MWGTDMTQTITIREGRGNVFVAVQHANSEVVGIHASWSANRFEALEPVRQGVQTGGSTSDLDITHRDRTILTLIVTIAPVFGWIASTLDVNRLSVPSRGLGS